LLYKNSQIERPCQAELKQAWGGFLTELGDRAGGWDWWATLTYRDPHNPMLPNWTKPGWKYTEKGCNEFLTHLTFENNAKPLYWVRARELQPWRGVPHYHMLAGGVADVRRLDMMDWWFGKYGIARIEPYDKGLGAGFYLCKYVNKELGDMEFSPGLTMKGK